MMDKRTGARFPRAVALLGDMGSVSPLISGEKKCGQPNDTELLDRLHLFSLLAMRLEVRGCKAMELAQGGTSCNATASIELALTDFNTQLIICLSLPLATESSTKLHAFFMLLALTVTWYLPASFSSTFQIISHAFAMTDFLHRCAGVTSIML